jgi:prepilin-type N-terminal cleavage/methylation domain-containing protein
MVRRGFTLVEVLLALALMLALSAGLFGYVWGLLDKRDRLVEVAQQQAAAAAVFEELENSLATTFAADASGRAGVKGDGASIAVRCRGVASRGGPGGEGDLGDLVGGEVSFTGGAVSARRFGRRDGEFEVVSEGVERLRLRYYNGSEWLEEFDSAAVGELPVAVEVAVWFGAAVEGDEDEFGSEPEVLREPDRVRVMIVPDGPTSWKGGA